MACLAVTSPVLGARAGFGGSWFTSFLHLGFASPFEIFPSCKEHSSLQMVMNGVLQG